MATPYDYADYPILVELLSGGSALRKYISYYASQEKVVQYYIDSTGKIPSSITETILSKGTFELLEESFRNNECIVEG